MPGYDDRKTGRGNGFAVGREDGAYYRASWQAAIGSAPDWIIITSFNEWPEGTYIEPSQAYGTRYLELTGQWAAAFRGSAPPPVVASAPKAPAPKVAAPKASAPKAPAPKAPVSGSSKPTPVPVPTRAVETPEPAYPISGERWLF